MKLVLMSLIAMISFNAHSANKDPKVPLATLKSLLNKSGAPTTKGTETIKDVKTEKDVTVPILYFGDKKINGDKNVVDEVKKTHQGTATVFVKMGEEYIRVTTNVMTKTDGTGVRATGTSLAHNAAYDMVQKGETYCGEVKLMDGTYDTCYEPIKDAANKVIGIYYVGYIK